MMHKFLRFALSVMALALPVAQSTALAEERRVGQVDSILDRLEKRLLDQEADGLSYGEKQSDPGFLKSSVAQPGKKYKFKAGKVEATAPDKDRLKAIDVLISDLERQVDALAANVQKTKQTVIDEAAIDNFVAIDAQLADTDRATIKTMKIRLDGYELYSLSDASGLWLPSNLVPIYAGPLQPGSHRLDLEVRLMLRLNPDLPLNSDVHRFISKSFNVDIVGGKSNTKYLIEIKSPEKSDGAADANLKELI